MPDRAGASPPRLRAARAEDAASLGAIARAAYGGYVESLGIRPRPLDDDYAEVVERCEVTVAERRGRPVGLIATRATEEELLIDNLAVDPAEQSGGVGRALIDGVERAAASRGYDSIYLFTHELMVANLRFYERLGYAEYDRRRYGDDVLVFMRKPLGPRRPRRPGPRRAAPRS